MLPVKCTTLRRSAHPIVRRTITDGCVSLVDPKNHSFEHGHRHGLSFPLSPPYFSSSTPTGSISSSKCFVLRRLGQGSHLLCPSHNASSFHFRTSWVAVIQLQWTMGEHCLDPSVVLSLPAWSHSLVLGHSTVGPFSSSAAARFPFVLNSFYPGAFFTTSRLIYAAGRERYLPSLFGRLHSTRKTPLNATLLQTAITSAFILMGGGFRSLINFSVVASWGFYFLSVSCDGNPRRIPKYLPGLHRSSVWSFYA